MNSFVLCECIAYAFTNYNDRIDERNQSILKNEFFEGSHLVSGHVYQFTSFLLNRRVKVYHSTNGRRADTVSAVLRLNRLVINPFALWICNQRSKYFCQSKYIWWQFCIYFPWANAFIRLWQLYHWFPIAQYVISLSTLVKVCWNKF